MSTAIASTEERPRVNHDETALILTSGPAGEENHAFADWFSQLRFEGWKTFQDIPEPVRTDEAWRFATIKALDLSGFKCAAAVDEAAAAELIRRSESGLETAGRMIFANDRLLERKLRVAAIEEQGVIWKPLDRAIIEHEALVSRHFMSQEVVLGSKKFAALHQANVRAGTFIYIPKNVEVALPLETLHWMRGPGASVFPHTLIIVGENSKVTVIDRFESSDPDEPGLACGVNDLFLESGAKLTYVNVQNWSRQALAIQINSTVVGRDASAVNMALNLGGKYARTESVSRLVGQGGRSDMLAVSVAEGAQEFDQRTLQDHRKHDTASDLLYKNSLDDQARTIFAGLIRVEPGAHRTDAYQKVRNLLLSDDAEANSMPGLEIMADEVRCTHGATSGQIEEEEFFYLLSRGIPPREARQLLVFGFLNEVIERLGNEEIGKELRAMVSRKFASRVG
jgi:Fe-S cluster assembly protein SufD